MWYAGSCTIILQRLSLKYNYPHNPIFHTLQALMLSNWLKRENLDVITLFGVTREFSLFVKHSETCLWVQGRRYIYTGCHRRKGQNFGRVFLRLNYTDITQNTYIQSWTVAELIARENSGLLAVPRTVCSALRNLHRATDLEWRVACSAGRMWSGQCALYLSQMLAS